MTGMAEGVTAGRSARARASSRNGLIGADEPTDLFDLQDTRARLGPWPYEPDVTQLVLLDHHTTPDPLAVHRWSVRAAQRPAVRAIRTGAMFPTAAAAFVSVGYRTIDTLALLDRSLRDERQPDRPQRPRLAALGGRDTRRLRAQHFHEVATLDRAAFGDPWANDVRSLHHITDATPRHRARIVTTEGPDGRSRIGGFAITGQAARVGYLQRLAVDPAARRRGIARRLVDDSLQWMRRRGATTAMVNTAVDNTAALSLYDAAGFRVRPETLQILELSGDELDQLRDRAASA